MSLRRTRPALPIILLALAALPATAQSPDPAGPYLPPPCTGTVFTDVTCSTPLDAWIEQLARDAITAGCGGGKYCPGNPVTRGQMAVFIEAGMRGTAEWSPGDRGSANTGLGFQALYNNPVNSRLNTAVGHLALFSQSFDPGTSYEFNNTAVGGYALFSNQPTSTTNGFSNTAIGRSALYSNTTGTFNSGIGAGSLVTNVVGNRNTSVGFSSLGLTTSSNNTAVGAYALGWNSTGSPNTAIGWKAGGRNGDVITGYTGSPVTVLSNTNGSYNTFVGVTGVTTQVVNCTAVGMDAYCDADNQVRLGNVFVTSIGGKVGWSALSDARAKSDVRDLDLGLDFLLALRPVSFRYIAGNGRTDMGFVAQEVEALLGDGYNALDIGGDTERTLSLRYTDLIAPLVKAVQEQQAQIEARDARIARLETRIEAVERQVQSLARGNLNMRSPER
jgi:hypothetical protein